MDVCPSCKGDLGDLDPVMEELSFNKMSGEHFFEAPCCGTKMRGFSKVMTYFVEPADGSGKPQMIGAA